MKKINKQEVLSNIKSKLDLVSSRLAGLNKEQKKKLVLSSGFVLLLLLALSSDFLSSLIPLVLVSYMISQVGGIKEELNKLKGVESEVVVEKEDDKE